jgi:uncharacterized protein (DUF2235 family)
MNKTVIFCADGTWNSPDQDVDKDDLPDPTNVYKLFCGLIGSLSTVSIREADEQEKIEQRQVAKYINGVGDSRNPIRRIMGGAFGAGIISRIVRGYTFISRNYEPGDDIVIVGFSRGAYTARALGGLIVSQGLLAKHLTHDKEEAYQWGATAWYQYRKKAGAVRLVERVKFLPAFVSGRRLRNDDLVKVRKIKAVAVWDTVGSLGIPSYIGDERTDTFRFADTKLSPIVENGFHAVALDEQRVDFTPTFWEPRANIEQILFPGAHGDVGGGYPTTNHESGLSDVALEWMVERLNAVGVRFSQPIYTPFAPDPRGTAHKPWQKGTFSTRKKALREFQGAGIDEHPAVAARMNAGPVVHEPSEAPRPYLPPNRS